MTETVGKGGAAPGGEARPAERPVNALGMPAGSIRALLALIVFGGIWYWMGRSPDRPIPQFMRDLLFVILGHYFAARQHAKSDGGPSPLWLPKGTIRLTLVGGFVVVGVVIARGDGVRANDAWVTLTLVGGFMLGVLTATLLRGRRIPRVVEDVRALVSLGAGVVLVALVFDLWRVPAEWNVQRYLVTVKPEEVLAAVVGFYFGSKS
ncbi:MAG TPA: hypothetical protein VEA69_07745 [Tepidisphaeraceae bacterium]|nr:hypothetical protein [Tepidisphaeraceae bacterium]